LVSGAVLTTTAFFVAVVVGGSTCVALLLCKFQFYNDGWFNLLIPPHLRRLIVMVLAADLVVLPLWVVFLLFLNP
jgi:hypothetical protein